MTGHRAGAGRAGSEGIERVRRFAGPRGSTLHLALATGDPARPLPANGGLRVRRLPVPDPGGLARRLAVEMRLKHRLHSTGFWGAKMLVTGADAVDGELLGAVADVLDAYGGTLYTGADMGVDAADMARLARLSPYVLNQVGSVVEPNIATAFGVLGAIEAWAGGSLAGVRVLVHGVGKVGAALAAELALAGAEVLTCDTAPGAPAVPGTRPVLDWAAQPVDVLAPCSVSDLVDPALARRLRCGAVIGSANAVLADEEATSALLHRRGVAYLPTPLVGAGAVIVDSIEHYAPDAFRGAAPARVYAFVARTVRAAAARLLAEPPTPSPSAALRPLLAGGTAAEPYCGLRFLPTEAEEGLQGQTV